MRAKIWILPLAVAIVVGSSIAYVRHGAGHTEISEKEQRKPATETASGKITRLVESTIADHTLADSAIPEATTPPAESTPAGESPASITQSLGRLAAMPPGDAAIALGQDIEAALTPQNAIAFIEALLTTGHPAVERTAHSALAHSADSETLTALVNRYGSTPEERRGRILQILDHVENPAATESLIQTVANDTSEKRSPLLVCAMNGLANLSTVESVSYLIGQVATDNEAFAFMALERVRTDQAREMIRAASTGNKDSVGIAPEHLAVLARIAQTGSR